MTQNAVEIHEQFLEVAPTLSPKLTTALTQNGPIELNPERREPFAQHLCHAVTGQQLSVKAARSIWKRVVAGAEDTSLIDYFAAVDPQVLRDCGLSRAKVKTVGAIAQAAQSDQLNATELEQLSTAERTERLTAIWGIGQWTADMMSIFYFGDPDIWPDGDLAARKTLEQLTSARRKTTKTAAQFAPYRSILALHMWKHANTKPA